MIKIKIKCFSQVKYALGKDSLELELKDGTTSDNLENHIRNMAEGKLDGIDLRIAINIKYSKSSKILINGDEVAECGIKEGLKIVDLTGAGDLFAAGFLHGHVNNMSLKESLDKGTEMSSKVIQQIGARL